MTASDAARSAFIVTLSSRSLIDKPFPVGFGGLPPSSEAQQTGFLKLCIALLGSGDAAPPKGPRSRGKGGAKRR